MSKRHLKLPKSYHVGSQLFVNGCSRSEKKYHMQILNYQKAIIFNKTYDLLIIITITTYIFLHKCLCPSRTLTDLKKNEQQSTGRIIVEGKLY